MRGSFGMWENYLSVGQSKVEMRTIYNIFPALKGTFNPPDLLFYLKPTSQPQDKYKFKCSILYHYSQFLNNKTIKLLDNIGDIKIDSRISKIDLAITFICYILSAHFIHQPSPPSVSLHPSTGWQGTVPVPFNPALQDQIAHHTRESRKHNIYINNDPLCPTR